MAGSHPHLRLQVPGVPGRLLVEGPDPLRRRLGLPGHEEKGKRTRGPVVRMCALPAQRGQAVLRALPRGVDAHGANHGRGLVAALGSHRKAGGRHTC